MIVNLEPGVTVYRLDEQFTVTEILNFDSILATRDSDGRLFTLKRTDITFNPPESLKDAIQDLTQIPEKELQKAKARLEAITPVLNLNSRREVERQARNIGVSATTIYNWIRAYESTGLLSSLVFLNTRGGKGKSRLDKSQEEIIQSTIKEIFKSPIFPTAQKVWEEIGLKCKNANIAIPSISSVRRRVRKHKEATSMEPKRKKATKGLIKGNYPDGLFPLHVVQIDHTEVDIILVDSTYRTELGRPWITLAIDVYSRMITGYYISFENPGYFGVGQAITNSVLAKDDLLSEYRLKSEWFVWGTPQFIHADNAKEFRGIDIKGVCKEYGMNLIWRPVARPNYGGHIERLVKTLNEDIHKLDGTTMSNIFERGDSNPQKEAVLTLEEFEEWLLIQIVDIYHNKVHSSIGKTPLEKYQEGIFGGGDTPPKGLPPMIEDINRFKLNMLPAQQRSVQRYGIKIENIIYHSEVLEKWVDAIEPGSHPPKKKKLTVRRDPRDISVIYVYDEHIEEFLEVPYANAYHPPTSLWEYRSALNSLKKQENRTYDQHEIFTHLERQREIIENAKKKTKMQKRNMQREHTRKNLPDKSVKKSRDNIPAASAFSPFDLDNLEAFDVVDDAPIIRKEEKNKQLKKDSEMPF